MRSLRQSENVGYSRDKKPGRFWNSMTLTSIKCLWLSSGLLKSSHGLKHFPLKFLFVCLSTLLLSRNRTSWYIYRRKKEEDEESEEAATKKRLWPWSPPARRVAERHVLKWTRIHWDAVHYHIYLGPMDLVSIFKFPEWVCFKWKLISIGFNYL